MPGDLQWRCSCGQLEHSWCFTKSYAATNWTSCWPRPTAGSCRCGLDGAAQSASIYPSVLRPVATRRLIIGSAPDKFLGEGECSCAFSQWVSACSCYRDGHWRAGGATLAAFRFVDSPYGQVDLVALRSHLTSRSPAVRARGAEEVLAPRVRLFAGKYEAPVSPRR